MNFYKLIIIFSHMLSVLTCEFFARLASLVRSIIYGSKPPVQELAKILEQNAARNMGTQKEVGFTAYSLPPTYENDGNITQGEVKKIIETFEKPAGAWWKARYTRWAVKTTTPVTPILEASVTATQVSNKATQPERKRLKEKEPNPIIQKFGRKIVE